MQLFPFEQASSGAEPKHWKEHTLPLVWLRVKTHRVLWALLLKPLGDMQHYIWTPQFLREVSALLHQLEGVCESALVHFAAVTKWLDVLYSLNGLMLGVGCGSIAALLVFALGTRADRAAPPVQRGHENRAADGSLKFSSAVCVALAATSLPRGSHLTQAAISGRGRKLLPEGQAQ